MRKLINDGWFFAKLPPGSTLSDAEKAGFEPVDLPHDWLIWQENDLYETADAWYRRTLDLQEGPEPVVMIRLYGLRRSPERTGGLSASLWIYSL